MYQKKINQNRRTRIVTRVLYNVFTNLPPIELYVKKEYLYDLEKGHGELVEGLWVSVKSIQGRALYFETYLPEYG